MSRDKLKWGGSLVLAFCMLGLLTWLAAGCAGSEKSTESTTTSTGAGSSATTAPAIGGSSTTGSTSGGETQRVIVGGKTEQEYEAALPDLEKAATASPNDLAVLQDLAVAQYNTGRYEEAAATYQKMLQLKDDAVTHNNYGNVLRDWKKTGEAKAEYEKAISADKTLVTAYLNLSSLLLVEGNLAEANKVLERGIAATSGEDQKRLKDYKEQLNSSSTTT